MSQSPLAPPPQTGQPIDSWLYLLWRRLTATGQMLWSSIVPGTSADVAAVVTDETGSPGSLVFSGNPTLDGCKVTTNPLLIGYGTSVATGSFTATVQVNNSGAAGSFAVIRHTSPGAGGGLFAGAASRGAAGDFTALQANDGIMSFTACGADGTEFLNACGQIIFSVDGAVSTGIVPTRVSFLTMNSSGSRIEGFRVSGSQVVTLGGGASDPALKVTPVASQARWIEVTGATSSTDPTIGTSGGNLACSAVFMPKQATTAGAPAYVLGGMYFDTTLNKLRIGGATAWETVTSI